MQQGTFSNVSLKTYEALVADTFSLDFSEAQVYDFTRCVRPDGSAYGTPGKCKRGTEQAKLPDESQNKQEGEEDLKKMSDEAWERHSKLSRAYSRLIVEGKMEEAKKMQPDVKVAWDEFDRITKKIEEKERPPKEEKKLPLKEKTSGFDSDKVVSAAAERQKSYNALQIKTKLNDEIADTLYNYTLNDEDTPTGFGYQKLNSCLRKPSSCKDQKESRRITENLDAALEALPGNTKGDPFFRGISTMDSPAAKKLYNILKNAKPGDVISDPAFGSFSSNPQVAKEFVSSGMKNILVVSRNKRLTPINMFASDTDEAEALLPRGVEQTVRKVTVRGDILIVEVD
jgi:hypothetical protein